MRGKVAGPVLVEDALGLESCVWRRGEECVRVAKGREHGIEEREGMGRRERKGRDLLRLVGMGDSSISLAGE